MPINNNFFLNLKLSFNSGFRSNVDIISPTGYTTDVVSHAGIETPVS